MESLPKSRAVTVVGQQGIVVAQLFGNAVYFVLSDGTVRVGRIIQIGTVIGCRPFDRRARGGILL